MTKYAKYIIYMNERIKQKRPSKPVIDCLERITVNGDEWTGLMQANCFELQLSNGTVVARIVYDPKKNPVETHEVKAWVEVMPGLVVVPA